MIWNRQTQAQPAACALVSHVSPRSHDSWSSAKYRTIWRNTHSALATMQTSTAAHISASPPGPSPPFDAAALRALRVCASVAHARSARIGNTELQMPRKLLISSGRKRSVAAVGSGLPEFTPSAIAPRRVTLTKHVLARLMLGESSRQLRSTRSISSVLSSAQTSSSWPSRQAAATSPSMAW